MTRGSAALDEDGVNRLAWTMGRRLVGYGVMGALIAVVVSVIVALEQRADLGLWHQVEHDEEFTQESEISDFRAHLELEERLFEQLDREVYQKTGPAEARSKRELPMGHERRGVIGKAIEADVQKPQHAVLAGKSR